MGDKDFIMTLLESLLASCENLIIALETIPMNELTMNYVTTCIMHTMLKCKKKEPKGEDVAMVL